MVEPVDLVILDNGNILVTDGAKACVHVFEDTGKYRGLFGNLTDLKCPAGMARCLLVVCVCVCVWGGGGGGGGIWASEC